jgi:uncharacterized protein YuzE
MNITFEPRTDMAYVYLTDIGDARGVDHTEPLNLDFDADGRLIGIEVDGAANALPLSLLARADMPRGG